MTKTRLILIVALVVFAGHMILIYPALPAIVASHFDAQGNPNGWMSKEMFLIIEAALLIFVIGEFLLVPRFVRRMPRSLINMPNKDYWLSDAHREETFSIFRSYFEVFGAMIVVLFAVVNQFVYSANIARTNLSSSVWMVIAGFLVLTAVWVVKFIREFRLNK